ncbi:MAG: hypothetical protein K2X87_14195 [Gemmataceae bacterium]|nr:hypothetical protein [Gemmataceae bacterium]
MARIRLYPADAGADTFRLADGSALAARVPRLFARVRVGPSPGAGEPEYRRDQRAIVGTGMPVTVVPMDLWEKVPFTAIPTAPGPDGGLPVTERRILGCMYRYQLARITLALFDHTTDDRLPDRGVLARLLVAPADQPAGTALLQQIVLGMADGVLEGRTLTFRHDRAEANREAWLDDPAG